LQFSVRRFRGAKDETGALMRWNFKQHSVVPGFSLTLGYTVLYLSLVVLLPLSALFLRAASQPLETFWHSVTEPRVMASYRLTFGASLVGALINVFHSSLVFGTIRVSRSQNYRRIGRFAVRIAHCCIGDCIDSDMREERVVGPVSRATWNQSCVFAVGCGHCNDIYRIALRGSNAATGA
jgi:hypothetical protein